MAKCLIYVYELVVCQFSFEGNGGTMLGGTVLGQKSSYLFPTAIAPFIQACYHA
ncbi:MAG: hypothetical protein F6K56_24155 [Moorea sp. SIO3G5]|nr:hypothetical protein [Moorena sp. SIO3G5]